MMQRVIYVFELYKFVFSEKKNVGTMSATTMAATLAAAGLNLHASQVTGTRDHMTMDASSEGSTDDITAATLLAAAAAHATATSISASAKSVDEDDQDWNEPYNGKTQTSERSLEVNVDVDDDDDNTESPPNAKDQNANDSISNDTKDLDKIDNYDKNRNDVPNHERKVKSPTGSDMTALELSNSTDKHKRRVRK